MSDRRRKKKKSTKSTTQSIEILNNASDNEQVNEDLSNRDAGRKASILPDTLTGGLGNLGRKILNRSRSNLFGSSQALSGDGLEAVKLVRSTTAASEQSIVNPKPKQKSKGKTRFRAPSKTATHPDKSNTSSSVTGKQKGSSIIARLSRNRDPKDESLPRKMTNRSSTDQSRGLMSRMTSRSSIPDSIVSTQQVIPQIVDVPVSSDRSSMSSKTSRRAGSWKFCIASAQGGRQQAAVFKKRLEWQLGFPAWLDTDDGVEESSLRYAVLHSDHVVLLLTDNSFVGNTKNNSLLRVIAECKQAHKHMVIVYETQVSRNGKPDARDYLPHIPEQYTFLRRLNWIPLHGRAWQFFKYTALPLLTSCQLPLPNEHLAQEVFFRTQSDLDSFHDDPCAMRDHDDESSPTVKRWATEDVHGWFRDVTTPGLVLLILGGTGCGKTTIAKELCPTHWLDSLNADVALQPSTDQLPVVARHFFAYDHHARRSARQAIASISAQLRVNVPGFRQVLDESFFEVDPAFSMSGPLSDLFDRLIAEPASQLPAATASSLVVVDALDECREATDLLSTLVERWKSPVVPRWLRLVLTSASGDPLFPSAPGTPASPVPASWAVLNLDTDPRTAQDLSSYLVRALGDMRPAEGPAESGVVNRIVAKARGSLLYCFMALKELARLVSEDEHRTSPEITAIDVELLPASLEGHFLLGLGRLHAALGSTGYANLLSPMVAAREPLPLALATHLAVARSGREGSTSLKNSVKTRKQLNRTMALACPWLLATWNDASNTTRCRISHKSVAKWLSREADQCAFKDAPALYVPVAKGHKLLSAGILAERFKKLVVKSSFGNGLDLAWISIDDSSAAGKLKRDGLSCTIYAVHHLQYHHVHAQSLQRAAKLLLTFTSLLSIVQWGDLGLATSDTRQLLITSLVSQGGAAEVQLADCLTALVSVLEAGAGALFKEPLELAGQLLARVPHSVDDARLQGLLASCREFRSDRTWWMPKTASMVGAIRRTVTTLSHKGTLRCVALSPSGNLIAAGSDAGEVVVWRWSGGWERVGHSLATSHRGVNALCFLGNGEILLSGHDSGVMGIWRFDGQGEPLAKAEPGTKDSMKPHQRAIVAIASYKSRCASCSLDGTIKFWNVRTLEHVPHSGFALEGHAPSCLAFSADLLAAGTQSGAVILWKLTTGARVHGRVSIKHQAAVTAVSFAPGGKVLCSGSQDGALRLWTASSAKPLPCDFPPGQPVQAVRFAPATSATSADWALATARGNALDLWRLRRGKGVTATAERLRGPRASLWGLVFSADGSTLVSSAADGGVRLFDLRPSRLAASWRAPASAGHRKRVSCAVLSPDRRTLATGAYDSTVQLWEATSGRPRPPGKPLKCADWVMSLCFSPDGSTLVAGSEDGSITLWDPESGEGLFGQESLERHSGSITCIVFSPDGRTMASSSSDQLVRLWDPKSGSLIGRPLAGHLDRVNVVEFSPNGKVLASGSHDGTIRLWHVPTGAPLMEEPIYGHLSYVVSLAFSPDSSILASGSADTTIKLWAVKDASPLLGGGSLGPHPKAVERLAFSRDGVTMVGVTPGGALAWDVLSGGQVASTDLCDEVLYDRGVVMKLPMKDTAVGGTSGNNKVIQLTLDENSNNGRFQYKAATCQVPRELEDDVQSTPSVALGPVHRIVFENNTTHFMELVS